MKNNFTFLALLSVSLFRSQNDKAFYFDKNVTKLTKATILCPIVNTRLLQQVKIEFNLVTYKSASVVSKRYLLKDKTSICSNNDLLSILT